MEYMPSSFDRVFIAWTFKIFIWEEPKVELPNCHMVGNGSSSSSAQRIRMTEDLKPRSPLDV